jgi:hypothetical protein
MAENYKYFAISCLRGVLYIGDLEKKTITKVRDDIYTRRAMHLDTKRGLLFSFVTDTGSLSPNADILTKDIGQWNATFERETTPNEVPDLFEDSREHIRNNRINRNRYQFTVYDINAAEAEGFPFKNYDETAIESEYRWLYFNLANFDGTPDTEAGYSDLDTKYYRTNFWQASPDKTNPDAFYISHRGLGTPASSPDANSVIKVTLTGDPRVSADGKVPKTSEYLSFERIYGFNGSQNGPDQLNYTGDFEVLRSHGEEIVIVNNFRDLSNFHQLGGPNFTISASALDPAVWFSEATSRSGYDGFYQVAVGKGDRVATCSFYSNSVVLFDIRPGEAIKEVARVH